VDPLVIGHRGARRLAVENTLESLRIALDLGADGVEFDVQMTADGELVLFHDDDLTRLANRPQAVTALTWRELRAMPLGDGQLQPQRVAHFDEAVELLAGRGAHVNAELKVNSHDASGGLHLADKFVRSMERVSDKRWLVSSFNRAPLAQVAEAGLERPLAALVDEQPPCDFWSLLEREAELDWSLASLNPHASLVNVDRLALWREQGWRVWAWTVNTPREWEYLSESAVTAIITDEPGALLQFLRRHGKR
jgi:glycerophosphoryl diester phosphodiesterase